MSPRTFAVVGTLVLAIVIGGSLLLREQTNVAHPSPSPSVVPADVFPSLVAKWAGAPHTVTGIGEGSIVRASINEAGLWQVSGATVPNGLNSKLAVTGPDRLTLTALDDATCRKGDVGTYRLALSPGKKRLTLTSESEPCAKRSIVVSGDWVRNDCKTGPGIAGGDFDCYGDLEAGTYQSREVDLRHEVGNGDRTTFGALTFTVPAGWSHVSDSSNRFWLMKSDEYPRLGSGDVSDASVYVFGHPQAASQAAGCPSEPQPDVGLSVQALMDFVSSLRSVDATAPKEITINGRSAQWTDLRMKPSWKGTCDWFDAPIAPLMYANTGVDGISATLRMRMVLVDIGHGDTALIEISVEDPARWDAVLAEGMSIVKSMQFAEPVTAN